LLFAGRQRSSGFLPRHVCSDDDRIYTELAAQVKDGQPHETLFRIMADIPMEWMAVGVERQGFPLDGEECMSRLNNLDETR